MKKYSLPFIIASLCLLLFSTAATPYQAPKAGNIAVIVNLENPIAELSAGEAKLYWLRKVKKRWPGINKNIRPADRKSTCSERESFYTKVLAMNSDAVETYFTKKQYENAEKPQDKFNSDADIINFIADEAGGIGYVNLSSLTPEAKAKIKVVLTISN
jgi:ABC-type phosphate transport system substrate-binding protein